MGILSLKFRCYVAVVVPTLILQMIFSMIGIQQLALTASLCILEGLHVADGGVFLIFYIIDRFLLSVS